MASQWTAKNVLKGLALGTALSASAFMIAGEAVHTYDEMVTQPNRRADNKRFEEVMRKATKPTAEEKAAAVAQYAKAHERIDKELAAFSGDKRLAFAGFCAEAFGKMADPGCYEAGSPAAYAAKVQLLERLKPPAPAR